MSSLTAVTYSTDNSQFLDALTSSGAVSRVLILGNYDGRPVPARRQIVHLDCDLLSGSGLCRVLEDARSDYLLVVLRGQRVQPGDRAVERLLAFAEDTGAGLVYSDFRDEAGVVSDHPLIDYQSGSIRDDFDFGSLFLISRKAAGDALLKHGTPDNGLRWGGLYDLRLKLSIDSSIIRLPEPLYTRVPVDNRATGARQFDYVDPRQRDYQLEMETVATGHLKRIGAWLAPTFAELPPANEAFPVDASVVIPVRNREKTIADAVKSVLSQKASFSFNVIVVDNHSTDNTTNIL
ncbi:MAG TPA: glycosyltransferase, partial [Blastocatellia bacterium]|nr:glycosyltransferase [Blastocatellia bacterium]